MAGGIATLKTGLHMIHSAWGIILASHKEEQLAGGADIGFLNVGQSPVIAYSMMAFEQSAEIDGVVVVTHKERIDTLRGLVQLFGCTKVKKVVLGTTKLASSLTAALNAIRDDATIAVVHEVSRPCIKHTLVTETAKAAKRYGVGLAASRLNGSVKLVAKGRKSDQTLAGQTLWEVKSPRAYKIEILDKALEAAAKKKVDLPDESAALDLIGQEVHLIDAPVHNIRILNADYIPLANSLLKL